MRTTEVLAATLAILAPAAALFAALSRERRLARQAPLFVSTFAAGMVAAIVATAFERLVLRTVDLDPRGAPGGARLLFAFGLAAPLEMALAVAAVAPFWRLRTTRRSERWPSSPTARDGMVFAAAAAAGLATTRHAVLAIRSRGAVAPLGLLIAGLALPWLASLWGYVLGRDPDRGLRAPNLARVWFGSAVFLAVQDELCFHQGRRALVVAVPLAACIFGGAAFLWRDPPAAREAESTSRLSLFFSAPAPSLGAIRDAFRHEDRPLTLRWLSLGVLVNAGVALSGVVVAVVLGRRFHVDFSSVDRPGGGSSAAGAVGLLAAGALAAFPVAGYLLARASGTRSVLEPALSSALAMLALLVFFGLLAPSALVFVLAVTPLAFGLSCVGAWFGLAR